LRARTKAELKRFEYAPRGSLAGYTIPKKKPSATVTTEKEGETSHSPDRESSSYYDYDRYDWGSPAGRGRAARGAYDLPAWHPAHYGYSLSWDPYWTDTHYGVDEDEPESNKGDKTDDTESIGDLSLHAGTPQKDPSGQNAGTDQGDPELLTQPEWDVELLKEREAALGDETGPGINARWMTHINKGVAQG
jgi:hypothetical protein